MDRSTYCRTRIEHGFAELCSKEGLFWGRPQDTAFDDSGVVKNAVVQTLVEQAAVLGFAQLDDLHADSACLARTMALLAFPDGVIKHGVGNKYPRFVQLPFLLHHDQVLLGTMVGGGFFKIIDQSDSRKYRVVAKNELQGAKAHPVGQSRKGDAPPDKPYALFREPPKGDDRRFQAGLAWMFEEALSRHKAGVLKTSTSLSPADFRFEVAAGGTPLRLRFDQKNEGEKAQRWVDDLIVHLTEDGHWAIPGASGMASDIEGDVVSVSRNTVVVKGDHVERPYRISPESFSALKMIGVAGHPAAQPIVCVGAHVYPGDSLFGPWEPQCIKKEHVVELVSEFATGGTSEIYRKLRQIRAWAILAASRLVGGRLRIPIEGVVPSSLEHAYLRLNNGAEDIRVQRILLMQGAPGVLKTDSSTLGWKMDLYEHSQTAMLKSRQKNATRARSNNKSAQLVGAQS